MEEKLIYKLFTISDLRDWLYGNEANGLSIDIIAISRARAFVENPLARPDDVVVSAVFDGSVVVGYTAAFAEEFESSELTNERVFWGSTQWLDPQYRGKGVAFKMMRNLKDAFRDKYLGIDSSIASIKLDQKQGSVITYHPKFYFVFQNNDDLKSSITSKFVRRTNVLLVGGNHCLTYENRYTNYIDHATYNFIKGHCGQYLFLHRREMMNWRLNYPLKSQIHGDSRVLRGGQFDSIVNSISLLSVQVFSYGVLCGYYAINIVDGRASLWYLYYDLERKVEVFSSVLENIIKHSVSRFETFSKELFDYFRQMGVRSLNTKTFITQVALTCFPGAAFCENLQVQGGDGDMF